MDELGDTSADEQVGDAISLRDSGRENEALARLREIVASHPRSTRALLVLGGLYRDRGEMDLAVTCFSEAVRIGPKLELASLGLFHSLYDSGNWRAAVVEMARFLRVSESSDYRAMIPEILRRHRGDPLDDEFGR